MDTWQAKWKPPRCDDPPAISQNLSSPRFRQGDDDVGRARRGNPTRRPVPRPELTCETTSSIAAFSLRPVHRNPCLVLGCTDKDALREAFGKFGAVAEVFCPEGQTFGFVTFEDKYDAENAMNALNGTQIGGKTVEVSDALPRAPPPRARTGPSAAPSYLFSYSRLESLTNGAAPCPAPAKVTDGKCANKHVSAWRTSLVKA